MYAAAGGASLASRQARQRQRQQKKTQLQQAKLHPPKASVLSVAEHGASTPTRSQSRQFHQLPNSYLRTPQSQNRKLSAGYTTQSKLLLPIDEGDAQSVLQLRMQPHGSHHSHSHGPAYAPHNVHPYAPPTPSAHPHLHFQSYADEIVTPKAMHRHSGGSSASFQHVPLPKSATASLPLVSQTVEPTPPTSPAGAAAVSTMTYTPITMTTTTIAVPHHDAIIVTPATPMASPGHVPRLRQTDDLDLPETADEKVPLTSGIADDESDESTMQPPPSPLERKCSVYRMRRTDEYEYKDLTSVGIGGTKRQFKELQLNQQLLLQQQEQEQQEINTKQYEPIPIDEPQLLYKGLPSGRKFQMCAYCEDGICACEHIECAQGRAAWLERDRRRCSVQEKELAKEQAAIHRRWVKRNRIQDASYGGSSDDEDFLGVLRGPSTFANAFLYVGLGTIALGLVIAFVGTGEKGFKTVELRLIGPSLIGLGLICCILRILFCICPSHCISSKKKARKKNFNKVDADHTTSLLRGESKRVSIARGTMSQQKYPISHRRSQSKMLNEGMEALRQLATTSLFMHNEQKPSLNRVVPVINEPEQTSDAPLEMKKLVTTLNVCDEEEEDDNDRNDIRMTDKKIDKKLNKTKTITTTAVIKSTKPKTKTTKNITATTEIGAGSQTLKKQITITSEPDETSTPCTVSNNNSNNINKNNTNLPLTTTSNLLSTNTGDIMMQETSLMDDKATIINIEEQSSLSLIVPQSNKIICTTTSIASSTTKITTTTPTTTTTTTEDRTIFRVATKYTGAISRIPTSMTSYNLPPSQPFSYAAGRLVSTGDRTTTTPPPLIRGPLGLTASSSTYAMPSTSNYHYRSKPLPASSSAPGATNTILTAAIAATATVPVSSREREQHQLNIPEEIQIVTTTTTTISSTVNNTAPTNTFSPAILSTTSSSSSSSYMSTMPSGRPTTNGRSTLALPTTATPANKFEPELLLSPAKLGQ